MKTAKGQTQASPGLTSGPEYCDDDGGQSAKRGVGLVPDTWSDPANPSFLCGDMAALGPVSWWYDWGFADIHGWAGDAYSCPGGRGPPGGKQSRVLVIPR